MAAAIRYSRRHLGITGTNPSVATLIVADNGSGPVIVGRGVTAEGGRPHAETQALAEAGELAKGATAYVTLEPCAHHGRTPPCAEALVTAGITRVVASTNDPDPRVAGRGYQLLRDAGLEVVSGVLQEQGDLELAGYLSRSFLKRPEVMLKLALSVDGYVGCVGRGQIAITGAVSIAQVHMRRAQTDAIMVGVGTVIADDPVLNCRLPGLQDRSPVRVILDSDLRMPLTSKLVRSARQVPLWIAANNDADPVKRAQLIEAGCRILATECEGDKIALPELLDDLAAQGIATVMVEGGAVVAQAFLAQGLVDRLMLFDGPNPILSGGDGQALAVEGLRAFVAADFVKTGEMNFATDRMREYKRKLS
ncbi:bifunctional diaminohydroxyphosphoribosylaminopyrimidine deaminase/5-amino-6-(5-phosphoribosylamino)uracil reductase RibD [Pseudochrobactrum sp. MP213Fo]|uniref:bifunctional diaminohydroxyphosphoribosylaminopyrimidine deaminase/5-amino-6-(5-phosphoribosylamino)uracil reductase RibD n=1 Tax=Pseudochrobactrum sp. MP213Fo TaxID=3022250 RepID=UPI003BA1D2A1